MTCTYSLSMAFQVFRKLYDINLPYALVRVDNSAVNLYDPTIHSMFICTQLMDEDEFHYNPLQKLVGCRIFSDNDSEYHQKKG